LCRSDEALYGRDYIVEPSYNRTETPNPGYTGNKTVVDKSIIIQTPCMWIIGPLLYISSSIFSLYFALALGLYPIYYVPWTPLRYYNYWSLHYHYNRSPYYRRIAYVRYTRIMPIIKEDTLLHRKEK
jgi:hypothetical protein